MKSIIKNIFEIKNESGFTAAEVSEAESRLELKLPKAFKDFYSTYAKHPMLNKDFGFEQPNNFKLENSEWLIFYGDVSGVYWWAINKKDFNKKDLPIYINFDGEGYKKETRSFENFLMLRIFEYGYFIFPFRLQCTKLNKIQVEKISETTKKFNTILEQ